MPKSIEKPEWFTKEKYLELKQQKITDDVIAREMLFISLWLLRLWKKDLGLIRSYNKGDRSKYINKEHIKDLYKKGYTITEINKMTGVSLGYISTIVHNRT